MKYTIQHHLIFYTTHAGKQPFVAWQKTLTHQLEAVVLARLARIRLGNFGDCKALRGAQGLYELRIDHGPGYRIYFGKDGTTTVVLLVGGAKKSQARDIAQAKIYWTDFKEHKNGTQKKV